LEDELFGRNTIFIRYQWTKVVKNAEKIKKIGIMTDMVKQYIYYGKGDIGKIYHIYQGIVPQIKLSEMGGLPSNLRGLFLGDNLT
jgi:hypothetical protein